MNEDTDGDGRISFDEFTGPKLPRDPRTGRTVQRTGLPDGDKDEL